MVFQYGMCLDCLRISYMHIMSWSNLIPLPISSLPMSSLWTAYFSLPTSCAPLYFMKNSLRPLSDICMCLGVAYLLEHYRCILEGNGVSLLQQISLANGWRLRKEPQEPLPCKCWKCFATAFEYESTNQYWCHSMLFDFQNIPTWSYVLTSKFDLKCPLNEHRGVSFKCPASQFGNHCAMWQISPQTNSLII